MDPFSIGLVILGFGVVGTLICKGNSSTTMSKTRRGTVGRVRYLYNGDGTSTPDYTGDRAYDPTRYI